MANFKIRISGTDDYVALMGCGGYCGGKNEDFVWTNEEEAKRAIEVCEKHWGKMELIAA